MNLHTVLWYSKPFGHLVFLCRDVWSERSWHFSWWWRPYFAWHDTFPSQSNFLFYSIFVSCCLILCRISWVINWDPIQGRCLKDIIGAWTSSTWLYGFSQHQYWSSMSPKTYVTENGTWLKSSRKNFWLKVLNDRLITLSALSHGSLAFKTVYTRFRSLRPVSTTPEVIV